MSHLFCSGNGEQVEQPIGAPRLVDGDANAKAVRVARAKKNFIMAKGRETLEIIFALL